MTDSCAISIQGVSKRFYRRSGRDLLRTRLQRAFRGDSAGAFYVLKNINLEVAQGEGLAIVGANGAGKSTLLALVVGLMSPDEGTVEVNGRVSALLELGAGFHPDLTGRENLILNAAMLGLSPRQVTEGYERIVEFAGIRDFMEQPLRTYSAGMTMRLAFSIAVNTDPDILIVDEVLAVGDQEFQQKCFEKIRQLRSAGKTMISVSHAPSMLTPFCNKAVWLDAGEVVTHGDIEGVLDSYQGRIPSAL